MKSRVGWMLGCLAMMGTAQAGGTDDLKAFPPAVAGQQRIVIRVPEVANPEDLKVEVIVGRSIRVDCNRHGFSGNVMREEAQGWGFSYYVLDELRGPVSTMMACPPGTPPHEQFVRAPSEVLAGLPYNAKVPIVIYVPASVQVRYRIWSAGHETRTAAAE